MICRRTLAIALLIAAISPQLPSAITGEKPRDSKYWRDAGRHLIDDVALHPNPDRIHVVVEIPAGQREKWEIDPESGRLFWDHRDGEPRRIPYAVPYPANYGSIPQTLTDAASGGDGDPLDAILLGDRVEMGEPVPARVIGVMKMRDDGEQDDKLIALPDEPRFRKIKSLRQLDETHPEILSYLKIFWTNYKDAGEMQFQQFVGPQEARELIEQAHNAWWRAKTATSPTVKSNANASGDS